MSNSTPLVLLDESLIKDLIYEVRGHKVMLDFDLARIYGYETRYFNRQVKNNIKRFDDDFMFQLNADEVNQLLRCKNFTSRDNGFFPGKKAGQESLLLLLPSKASTCS